MNTNKIRFQHIRHATSILKLGGLKILIDPMLSDAKKMPPVILTNNKLLNPLVGLPINAENVIDSINYLLLTHLHFDHLDKHAIKILPKETRVICSKSDSKKIQKHGFKYTNPVDEQLELDGMIIKRFQAVHGTKLLKILMGSGSSYLIEFDGFKIFLTGDCILNGALMENLKINAPDLIIANAGAAKFKFGDPITMSIKNILKISKTLPGSKIIVVHLNALNHCSETRKYCKEQITNNQNIYIPEDGEEMEIY